MLSLSLSLSQSSLNIDENSKGDNNNSNNHTNILVGSGENGVFTIDTTNIPSKDNYIFLGYSSTPNNNIATTPEYKYCPNMPEATECTTNPTGFVPNSITLNAPTDGSSEVTKTLYAVWQPVTFDMAYEKYGKTKYTASDGKSYYAMQDITSDICNAVAIGTFEVPNTGTLLDKRDNKTYTVARLKMTPDGSKATCWMTQNLALVLNSNTTLTNQNTDLNSVSSWKPVRSTATTLNTSTWKDDNNTPYSYNSGNTDYGVYYNWSAAVASNNTSSLKTQYTNAPDSVCPKGWRLPQVYDGTSTNRPNEFGNLLYAYGLINDAFPGDGHATGWVSFAEAQRAPVEISLSGAIVGSSLGYSDTTGHCWSSSIVSLLYAYNLSFTTAFVLPQTDDFQYGGRRFDGYPVRCILR